MRKRVNPWLAAALGLALHACQSDGPGPDRTLVVYTTSEGDELASLQTAFEKDNPGIRLSLLRDSTGIITDRLIAEREHRQADAIWGLAATSVLLLADRGMLEPYAPAGVEAIPPMFKDGSDPPLWVGLSVWMVAVCANTVELKARDLPIPTSWADLADPRYRGQIVMPNPASSGAGYADVSSWLQMMGEERGWTYMDALHQNIAQYVHSGSKPCTLAGTGEFALGISFDYRGLTQKARGEPIEVVFPREGSGWDLSAAAIVKGTPRLAEARRLMDWAITPRAMQVYNADYAIVTRPGIARSLAGMPPEPEKQLARNDFVWAATNRERVLREWSARYDAKSEPKP
jgi:iron(III) transport system substrate-binding protein